MEFSPTCGWGIWSELDDEIPSGFSGGAGSRGAILRAPANTSADCNSFENL
jgi:hypothetical protein